MKEDIQAIIERFPSDLKKSEALRQIKRYLGPAETEKPTPEAEDENFNVKIFKVNIGDRMVSGVDCFTCKNDFGAKETMFLVEFPEKVKQFLFGYSPKLHTNMAICPSCFSRGPEQFKDRLCGYILERTTSCIEYEEKAIERATENIQEQKEVQWAAEHINISIVENDNEKLILLKGDDLPF